MNSMIELRWLRIKGWRWGAAPVSFSADGNDFRVLQARYRTNVEESGIQPPIWSEWKDIPTEEE